MITIDVPGQKLEICQLISNFLSFGHPFVKKFSESVISVEIEFFIESSATRSYSLEINAVTGSLTILMVLLLIKSKEIDTLAITSM